MENNIQSNIKNEVITLILADMRNRKLIMGLDAIGLSTDEFNTNLSELIFEKMGIAKQHYCRLENWYEETIFNILDIDLNAFREHQVFLAFTFYDTLQEKCRKLQAVLMWKQDSKLPFVQCVGLKRCDN